ncbi:hypothetical protein WG66_003105 [Moniliophthora roreri]|nr:hypothetical protein WG66_003105 [Moniliophthora roreri]
MVIISRTTDECQGSNNLHLPNDRAGGRNRFEVGMIDVAEVFLVKNPGDVWLFCLGWSQFINMERVTRCIQTDL